MSHSQHERKWWKEAVVYQIYPASFADSNGDGIGDIPGVLDKLDYLASLGVNVVWLSPHYKSPQVDMGYDISDYKDIHAPYGTLDDCQNLIDECHARDMKIIFDLVINHTSSEHAWFKESRSSKDNPKRDWYFWRPPKYDKDGNRHPPNNWRSQFTIPAWTWDEHTQEYYLHVYASEMPDLNWENPETRQAIYQTSIKFWLDRGIDGFRIDTVNKYSKDITFPDAEIIDPFEKTQLATKYYSNGPRIHEFLTEMCTVFDSYKTFDGGQIMTVGELPNTPMEADVMSYVSAAAHQMNMVFNFDVVCLGQHPCARLVYVGFQTADFKKQMSRWQKFVVATDAWTTVFLENHDQGRSISRFGSDKTEDLRIKSGKLLAIILTTMTGTLFLYQGQELGMINPSSDWPIEDYKDIRSVNFYNKLKDSGASSEELQTILKGLQILARDNARLPMQWNDSPNAGFCSKEAKPWMRVHDQYRSINAAQQLDDPTSLLNFWKKLLQLRREHKDLFIYGDYQLLDESNDEDLFVFAKSDGVQRKQAITVANMSDNTKTWQCEGRGWLLISNVTTQAGSSILGPWEARVYIKDM